MNLKNSWKPVGEPVWGAIREGFLEEARMDVLGKGETEEGLRQSLKGMGRSKAAHLFFASLHTFLKIRHPGIKMGCLHKASKLGSLSFSGHWCVWM